jgi:hypothetical protein
MTIIENEAELLQALHGEMTPKFLATRNPEGIPNVVPCVSISPADDQPDTLFFGNFLLRKSIKNLEVDKRAAVLVITQDLKGWMLKCDFIEFQRTGTYVDRQMSSNLLRYNAYTGIRNAGVMRVLSIEGRFNISKIQVLLDYLRAKIKTWGISENPTGLDSREMVKIPLPTRQEFARMVAVKVLAWVGEDGYPIIVPTLSMQPAGDHALVGILNGANMPKPSSGARVATNILTFQAISYQIKGLWQSSGNGGKLQAQEVYAGGPPYPGGRVA